MNSCINAVSRVAPCSRSPAAAAICSVLAVCSSAAAVTSSLDAACSVAELTHLAGALSQLLHDCLIGGHLASHGLGRVVDLFDRA